MASVTMTIASTVTSVKSDTSGVTDSRDETSKTGKTLSLYINQM